MTAEHVIPISKPFFGEEEWQALREPLESGWLTQGPKVAAFEQAFATRHESRHAVAVTSCTTGLHLALKGLGIGTGDEVIVPSFTWVSTANAVLYCGATPVLVDVDRKTFNLDASQLGSKLTERTKAVLAVHLFGMCADMDSIRRATPENVHLVEDAACAAGGVYKEHSAGALGSCGVFSFHPRKSITTGEGGMITTNDDAVAARIRMLRNHGASISEEERHNGPKPYLLPDFPVLGFNYRMTDLQGAVGLVQLGRLDGLIAERARGAAYYRKELRHLDWLDVPAEPEDGQHAWQAFVVYVHPDRAPRSRNEIMEVLKERGIAARPGTHSIHMLDYYRRTFEFADDDFPGARDCAHNTMAIPLHNHMAPDDYARVVDALVNL